MVRRRRSAEIVAETSLTDRLPIEYRFRKCFGGGIRQSGALAASADFALTHNFDKLRETHAMAKRLADGLEALGVRLLVKAETSMVRVAPGGPTRCPSLMGADAASLRSSRSSSTRTRSASRSRLSSPAPQRCPHHSASTARASSFTFRSCRRQSTSSLISSPC